MFYNRIPKPLPILVGLPDDPKPKFIWMKMGDDSAVHGRLSKRNTTSLSSQQRNAPPKGNFSYRNSQNELSHQTNPQALGTIYYEDFNMEIRDSLCTQSYPPIKNASELQESLKNFKYRYDANHPQNYEIFGGFEGCNIQQIYYLKQDVVKIVLRSDTNTHGYCKWFSFGLKVYAFKDMKISINIINLRAKENDRDVHVHRISDDTEFYVQSTYSLTRVKRVDGYYAQCSFDIKSSYDSYIVSYQKPYKQQIYGQLGLTKLHNPIQYWVQKNNGPLILVIAGIRPADANTSYLAEELIKQLKQTQLNVIVIPQLNRDGAMLGNSRCNLSGKDLSGSYQYPNPYLCPEIKSVLGIENVQIAIELRMHEKPHVVSSLKFNCGLPQRKKNMEMHDISTKYSKFAKIFISSNRVNYEELAFNIISILKQQQPILDNISFKSETDHEDDMLDNFTYNPQPQEIHIPQQHHTSKTQLHEILQTATIQVAPQPQLSLKEQESVNQLKNLEWKDLSHRSEISRMTLNKEIQPQQQTYYEKPIIKKKIQYRQHSESQNQSEKYILKTPFLPSREQIFEKYSNLSRSPKRKTLSQSQNKLQTVTQYQIFRYRKS